MKWIFEKYPPAVLLLKRELIIVESKITLQGFQPHGPGFCTPNSDFLKLWPPVWNGVVSPFVFVVV